jgi:shikimate dehydrogenase
LKADHLQKIRLGLVGDNIAASRAPDLHHAAAKLCGIDVTYERLVPKDLGLTFDQVVARAKADGLRGLNITYPYKEQILKFATVEDPAVAAIGACNTVLFGERPIGLNTDYTGYIAAFKNRFGKMPPGVVALAGSGGAGKAIAFGLAALGAKALRIFDVDAQKAQALAAALAKAHPAMSVRIAPTLQQACEDAEGLVNCTPMGMVGYGGNAFAGIALSGRTWVFDAVYTPLETPFLKESKAAGVSILGGYELFLYQGIHAFELFTGQPVDAAALRQALATSAPGLRF